MLCSSEDSNDHPTQQQQTLAAGLMRTREHCLLFGTACVFIMRPLLVVVVRAAARPFLALFRHSAQSRTLSMATSCSSRRP